MSVEESLLQLQGLLQHDMPPAADVRDSLYIFGEWVKFGGPSAREHMLEEGGYETVIKAWSLVCYSGVGTATLFSPDANMVREASLAALYSLTAGFPEIIDGVGWIMIWQALDTRMPDSTLAIAMKVIRNVCIKSEKNRESISWELGMMEPLVLLIKRDKPSPEFVREWCGAMKTLILCDDLRVAYNRAPERKRLIQNLQALPVIAGHLYTFEGDEATINAIVVLLGSMAVNEDMCISIESGNVFPAIVKIFKTSENKMLVKNTLSLLRYLNISATVREKCTAFGLIKWVLLIMMQYSGGPFEDVLEVGCSCLAFMTLRNACNVAQFMLADGVPTLFEIMGMNSENIQIMKGGCLTLRNLGANGGSNARSTVLYNGGEGLLGMIWGKYPDLRENYVKPALRDLDIVKMDEIMSQPVPQQPAPTETQEDEVVGLVETLENQQLATGTENTQN